MTTLEIVDLIEKLKKYYNKDVIMIKSIDDDYDVIKIVTLYGDVLLYDRGKKNLDFY